VKGVSEVLGSAFLLAIGVSIAGIYSVFAPQLAQDTGGQVAQDTRTDIKCGSASIDIRDLRYTAEPAAEFNLVNTGTVDLEGITAYAVNDTEQIIASETIQSLQTSETRKVNIPSNTQPGYITAAVEECSSLRPKEEF